MTTAIEYSLVSPKAGRQFVCVAGRASGLGSLDSPPAPMSGATLHRFWERKEKRYVNVYHWQRSAQATSQE